MAGVWENVQNKARKVGKVRLPHWNWPHTLYESFLLNAMITVELVKARSCVATHVVLALTSSSRILAHLRLTGGGREKVMH